MKKILMIGTGGTIASEITESGLTPGFSTEDLTDGLSRPLNRCAAWTCVQVCNIDSTNMTPSHWLKIASVIKEQYDRYDGFVICHGTTRWPIPQRH